MIVVYENGDLFISDYGLRQCIRREIPQSRISLEVLTDNFLFIWPHLPFFGLLRPFERLIGGISENLRTPGNNGFKNCFANKI